MDGMDKSEVKRVEDVTLTTTEVPGTTTVTDVAMAENITAAMPQDTEEEEDASEIVNAIIADVTTAAVSTATAATDVTAAGSMETDDTPSTSVTTDVCKAAEAKACTDSSTSDDAATVTDVAATATTDADVKAIMAMDTKVVEPITAPVTAAFCITDPVAADNDIKAPVTDDIKITQPVTADKDITESVTVLADKVTEPVTAGKGIVAPLTADTDIAAPVTMNKDITEPVTARTADKDIAAPVTMNKDITEPVTGGTADKDIAASVTMNKDITEPVTASTADKDIAAPVTMDKDITEPVTAGTADKDIAAPVTMDKDITESVTAGKDIAESVTAEKDIISPVLEDSDIPAPVTAYKDIPAPVTTDKDRTKTVMTDKDSTAPVTVDVDIATSVITDKYITQPITSDKNITYPVTTDKDVTTNDTSLDCSNISLPSFLESKSSTGDKFTGNTPECSFEKPQSRSAISSIENSKEVPVMLDTSAEQKTSSLVDEKQRTPTELNMQRPFHNIGVSENSSFTSDVGKYLEGGVQGMSSLQSTPSELPSSSSSKDLILMSLAKDAMSTPDDSLQESRNVDNIEIIQLIEDTTSVSMSMDVDRDASLAEEKEHFGDDLSAAAPVDGEQPAIVGTTTQSSADDSLLSKDSVNKPDKEGEEQPSTTTPRDVPEESCKSEASGKEANIDLEGDVDMVEEKQCKASGDGGKPGTDGEGGEKGDDAEKKDAKSKSAKKRRPGITAETEEEDDENEDHTMPANKLIEYQWPQEKGSEWYMLQEQVTEYLDIVSFKRKYPDLHRRPVEVKEKLHLLESNIAVSEMQCDLGLTALKSDQVHELMARDYPDKFKEYAVVLQARERQKITDHHKGYELPTIDKTKLTMYMKKAVKSAAEYNSMFMKEKREERKAYFDLQTNEVHYPRQQKLVLPKQVTQVGSYPVALIPGQFQDYYKKYTSQELKYFPMNTALYNPPRPLKSLYPDPNQPSEEETEEEKDETKSGSSGKGENDSSSSRAVRGASVGGGQLRVLMQSLEWGTQPVYTGQGALRFHT